jgi:hypothetical protein
MILELENNFNSKLIIDLREDRGFTPRIIIGSKDKDTSEKAFLLNLKDVETIKEFFGRDDKNFYSKMAEWLKDQSKELVDEEHLKSLLEAAKYTTNTMYKQRDAIVEAINRIEPLIQIYTRKGEE